MASRSITKPGLDQVAEFRQEKQETGQDPTDKEKSEEKKNTTNTTSTMRKANRKKSTKTPQKKKGSNTRKIYLLKEALVRRQIK
ncbi:hypothetical protein C922_05660 [Plasmodium inui San Antonio 1]|uniref:Uncharacterized protein n=1 Tax=Plasmodium inui San Antonio 1 TaxID=1237626 RepID=W6ZSR4_9APIC|nr:hypothetical protein C922_05660 [Plasmodium inui San Antonio 1]EUD63957.1 hypothetical protein C922_05660 [Plasmodium inui San Antonio 1]